MIVLNTADTSDDQSDGAELDELEEGMVMDMAIEHGHDACSDKYCTVADQHVFDVF